MVKRIVRLVLLLLGICALAGATLLVALRWDSIPAEVPTNFTGAGQPDAFEPKGTLWAMLGFGWGVESAAAATVIAQAASCVYCLLRLRGVDFMRLRREELRPDGRRWARLMRLGISEQTAAEDACKIEHDISDETFEAIKRHVAQSI